MTAPGSRGRSPGVTGGEHPVIAAMLGRRAVPPRHLGPPGPSRSAIETMVLAAAAAPDHGRLRPYRFIHVPADQRPALADAFAAAMREQQPGAGAHDLTRAREKALAGPELIAVVVRITPDRPEVPAHEQWAAAGAALAQLLLAADALGFGAMAVSGERCRSAALRQSLALSGDETLLCFVAIGTSDTQRPPREPPALTSLLTTSDLDKSGR